MWQVERGAGAVVGAWNGDREGDESEGVKGEVYPAREVAAEQDEEDGKQDVELFFDGEGPGVEEGFRGGVSVEVAGLEEEKDVRKRKRGGN